MPVDEQEVTRQIGASFQAGADRARVVTGDELRRRGAGRRSRVPSFPAPRVLGLAACLAAAAVAVVVVGAPAVTHHDHPSASHPVHPHPTTAATTTTTRPSGPGGGQPVDVTLTGVTAGTRVYNTDQTLGFSVTYSDPGHEALASTSPVVVSTAAGTLEVLDPTTGLWTAEPLDDVGGASGNARAFTLRPGASTTFQYRLTLSSSDPAGPATIGAEAVRVADHTVLSGATVAVTVVAGCGCSS